MWADTEQGRAEATPGAKGTCPCCGGEVIAKCGSLISWHWSHVKKDCDLWYEPESDWHRNWKKHFPESWQEVTIGEHRADVRSPEIVVEFQRSHIAVKDIEERERFYGDMIWVLHWDRLFVMDRYSTRDTMRYLRKWESAIDVFLPGTWLGWGKYAIQKAKQLDSAWFLDNVAMYDTINKTWQHASKPIFIDFGGGDVFKVMTFSGKHPGVHKKKVFGLWLSAEELVRSIIDMRAAEFI